MLLVLCLNYMCCLIPSFPFIHCGHNPDLMTKKSMQWKQINHASVHIQQFDLQKIMEAHVRI
jgi:hypothetical protein